MKRFALLSLLALSFMGCEDTQDNNAIVQGSANEEFFKAGAVASVFDNGRITISGNTELENLTLRLAGTAVGTYTFGPGSNNAAEFRDLNGQIFTTGTAAGDGEAVISEYNTMNNTLTGTFIFNAHSFGILDTLNFQRGVFFQVPIINGTGDGGVGVGFVQGMTGLINGVAYEAVTVEGVNVTGFILVNGVSGNQIINLRFNNTYGPGDYDLAGGEFSASYSVDGTEIAATSGTLTIISNNVGSGEVRAQFSIAGDGFEITNGAFQVIY